MTRASVAVIVLSATAAVMGAQAQTQTVSPKPTIWDHNGSVMYLVTNGSSREFHYQTPRPGMLDAGARPGSVLFRGELNNGQYVGTAYIFNAHCGPIPFQVKGSILNNERIVLTGQAEQFGIQAIKNQTRQLKAKSHRWHSHHRSLFQNLTCHQSAVVRVRQQHSLQSKLKHV
jgi:hypothetical protein